MKVFVGSVLSKHLAAIDPTAEATLITDFSEWKSGDEFEHPIFCHDQVENGLHHVHMVPLNKIEDLKKWDAQMVKKHTRHKRRSDRYLLFADGGRFGYLLIQILDDPGAHALWKNKAALKNYLTVADNFIFNGSVA